MKYMVTGTRNLVPRGPKMGIGLFQAAKQWIEAGLANGTHDLHYVHIETNTSFTISNANSHEGVMDLIYDYPLYPFFDCEVTPLCEWSKAYDNMVGLLQKMLAMT